MNHELTDAKYDKLLDDMVDSNHPINYVGARWALQNNGIECPYPTTDEDTSVTTHVGVKVMELVV